MTLPFTTIFYYFFSNLIFKTFAMAQSSIPSREIPENVQKSSSPASERLREYLHGLEKKLDAFSSLIVSETASDPLTSTRKSLPSEIPDSRQNIPSYRSERWRDYFGADFKYIPAKTELNQRLSQDYRYITGLIHKIIAGLEIFIKINDQLFTFQDPSLIKNII